MIADSTREKLSKSSSGINNHFAKLNEKEVLIIYDLLNYGFNSAEVMSMTGVNRITINDIKVGRTWSHITGIKYVKSRERRRISKEDALKIYELTKQKIKHQDISDLFNVPLHIVSDISRGKTWNSVTNHIAS